MDRADLLDLSRSPLFSHQGIAALESFLGSFKHAVRAYESGALLLLRGSKYEELFILLRGEVAAEIGDDSGRNLIVEIIKAPETIASAVLFAEGARLPVSVRARTDVRVAAFPKAALISMLAQDREMLARLLGDLGSRLLRLAERTRLLGLGTLRQKVASYLASALDTARSKNIELGLGRDALAEYLGAARPSLSRELSAMRDDGLIECSGRTIRVIDEERLRSIAFDF
jgi:CRP-like cAMP-binding protein